MPINYVQAKRIKGAWELEDNPIWCVPKEGHEVRFDVEFIENPFHQVIKTISGLVVDLERRVYGVRKMHHPKESGYQMEGRVSLGGKKYRAFTGGGTLFVREDGSLIDVASLIVCNIDEDQLVEVKVV